MSDVQDILLKEKRKMEKSVYGMLLTFLEVETILVTFKNGK